MKLKMQLVFITCVYQLLANYNITWNTFQVGIQNLVILITDLRLNGLIKNHIHI
jgi:hypothetical protein